MTVATVKTMSSTTIEERQVLSAVFSYCYYEKNEVFKFKHSDLLDTDGRLLDYIVRKLKGRCGPPFGWKLTRKVFRLLDGSLREKKVHQEERRRRLQDDGYTSREGVCNCCRALICPN